MGNLKQKGEGNYEAARKFNKNEKAFVQGHPDKVNKAAADAKKAVNGPEKAGLDAAEREGRRHAKGEDPAVKRR
jgi:hypothetical protein